MADHYICPACGTEVRVGSKNCPGCNPPKPWEQVESLDGLDLDRPEDDSFDYDEFVREEFGGGRRPAGISPIWWATAILLLIALAAARLFF
jgi:hypothetical protein